GEPIDEAVFRAMKPNTVFSQNQSPNASAHPKPPEANAAPTTSSVRTALPDASTTMRGTRMKVISYKIDGQEYADRIAYVDIDWPNRDQDTSVYNLMMTIYQNDGKTGTFAFLRGDARDRMWRFDAYGWMSIWQAEGDLIWAIEDKKLFMPEVLTIDNAFWGKDWASPNRLIFSDRDDDYTIRIMIELDGPVFTR
ncbi:MAG: hypothetical protein LBS86_05585, partial [Treponema sp.]|nr:hypothetical protein [Treponema sp.]